MNDPVVEAIFWWRLLEAHVALDYETRVFSETTLLRPVRPVPTGVPGPGIAISKYYDTIIK